MKQHNIYIKYIIVLVILIGYYGYKEYFPKLQKWGDKKAEQLIDEGNTLANKGYWSQAISYYNTAILLGGKRNDSWAYNCRGIIHWRRFEYSGKNEINFEKALADYDKAISLSNTCYPATLCNKGLLYASRKDEELSNKFFDMALKCGPKDTKIYEEKSNALFDLGKYIECIDFSQNALNIIGESDDLYFNIAYSYEMVGDYKKAVEYYDKVIKFRHGQAYASYTNASYCKLALKDYKGAIDYAHKSIQQQRNNIHPYNFITFAALEQGNLDLAKEYNNRAFNLYASPNYLSFYNYARIKYLEGDKIGARQRLEKARTLFAKDTNTWQFEKFEELCDQLEAKL